MNAVIALCHFCELHGPSILFCTQPFHCLNHTAEEVGNVVATPSACGISHNRIQKSHSELKESEKKTINESVISRSRQSTCEACRSFAPGEPAFISINQESHISYISMQYPEQQQLYAILRHACVRSLSCEVCPGREGPIMFGDEASGFVFSYTFFLKDLQSRGFQRWYSIICVMLDRISLVNSWIFLNSNFRNLIDELQAKAECLYKSELLDKPKRESRLQARNLFPTNDNLQRARGGQVYRSLPQITNDKNVFQSLHETFSWILQTSGDRYTEILLKGAPLDAYLNESIDDVTLQMEDLIINSTSDYEHPVFNSVRHMYEILGREKFQLLAFHVVRGDQVIVQGDYQRTVLSALNILKELIPAGCFRCRPYEDTYLDSWRCNFLGLKYKCVVPDHLLQTSLYVRMIISKEEDSNEHLKAASTSHFRSCENSFSTFLFDIQGSPVVNEPCYLTSLIDSLKSENITDKLFEVVLVTLKERWMGKVKVMFKFSCSPLRTTEEKDKLLRILQAKPNDEILLKYWMTSFSRSYRAHLLKLSKTTS